MFGVGVLITFLGLSLSEWAIGRFEGGTLSYAQVIGLDSATTPRAGTGSGNMIGQPATPPGTNSGGIST